MLTSGTSITWLIAGLVAQYNQLAGVELDKDDDGSGTLLGPEGSSYSILHRTATSRELPAQPVSAVPVTAPPVI
jgi:hypothetical protein